MWDNILTLLYTDPGTIYRNDILTLSRYIDPLPLVHEEVLLVMYNGVLSYLHNLRELGMDRSEAGAPKQNGGCDWRSPSIKS